ncbi:hypothetical protein G2W53_023393 [Senna tora]|uniref:Uncharacterized protein n=1 Tax=Senna tora TaxID=362788 RepID=A0A834WEF8_9FABA|nr:hypothetical protein G2W53_023393 [Senna tora]
MDEAETLCEIPPKPALGDASVLVRINSSLCCDGIELILHWECRVDITVLKHNCCVTKYEVHCANADMSAPLRNATAWCLAAPAVLRMVKFTPTNPGPLTAAPTPPLLVSGPAIHHTAIAGYDGLINAIADDHQVLLVLRDRDILVVDASNHIYDIVAVVGAGVIRRSHDCIIDGGEIP